MALLKWCGRFLLDIAIITLAILVFPGIPPNAEMDDTRFAAPPALDGPLAQNLRLASMELLLGDRAAGPESTAEWRGAVYTGVEDGSIVRITAAGAETVARLAGDCEEPWNVPQCGRPLGMRFDDDGTLFVADAYLGIHRVNVTSGSVDVVVPAGLSVDGVPLRFFNDVAPSRDGLLYFTVSSAICDLYSGLMELAVKGTGRLLVHDPRRNTTEVLVSNINFANGVALDVGERAIVFVETGMFRVHRYWLKGDRAGTSELFADNFPGFPDNIRSRGQGGYYVGMCVLRYKLPVHETMRPYPLLNKLILRLVTIASAPVWLIEQVYPNQLTQTILYKGLTLRSMQSLSRGGDQHGMVVELDASGAVVGSLHSDQMTCISQLSEHAGHLYVGSPFSNFLGRVRQAGRTVHVRASQSDELSVSVGV